VGALVGLVVPRVEPLAQNTAHAVAVVFSFPSLTDTPTCNTHNIDNVLILDTEPSSQGNNPLEYLVSNNGPRAIQGPTQPNTTKLAWLVKGNRPFQSQI